MSGPAYGSMGTSLGQQAAAAMAAGDTQLAEELEQAAGYMNAAETIKIQTQIAALEVAKQGRNQITAGI